MSLEGSRWLVLPITRTATGGLFEPSQFGTQLSAQGGQGRSTQTFLLERPTGLRLSKARRLRCRFSKCGQLKPDLTQTFTKVPN